MDFESVEKMCSSPMLEGELHCVPNVSPYHLLSVQCHGSINLAVRVVHIKIRHSETVALASAHCNIQFKMCHRMHSIAKSSQHNCETMQSLLVSVAFSYANIDRVRTTITHCHG